MRCVILIEDIIGVDVISPGQYIKLLPDEVMVANRIGELRQEQDEKSGRYDNKRSHLTGLEIHQIGAKGEMAFCKLTNSYPPLMYMRPDDGADLIFRAKRIDVKTLSSEHSAISLNITMTGHRNTDWRRPDYYAVMQPILDDRTFVFHGVIDYKTAHDPKYITAGKGGKAFRCVPQSILKGIAVGDLPDAIIAE